MSKITIEEILWNLRIDDLTPMQQAAIAEWRKGKDLVLLAPTGSGKTLTYLLALLQSLTDDDVLQALILVPSRELALQTEQVFKAARTGIPVMSCYGGRPAMDEHRQMKALRPKVIVATPGRMNDHMEKGNVDISHIHTLVIDEFDKCLELGFREEMNRIVLQLKALKRRFLLSATDAPDIPDFVSAKDFIKVNFLAADEQIPERITVYSLKSPEKDKLRTVARLLCFLGSKKSLIFVNYRESVERVCHFLQNEGIACEMFHGGMEQKDRERALYKFGNGSCNVFISTDLAARGLDIPDIDCVIHYHLPLNEDAYIHRNGRTARWDAEGKVFMIVGPGEHIPEFVCKDVKPYILSGETPRPALPLWVTLYIGKGKKDKINKIDIVGFLTKVGGLAKEDIGRIDVKEHYAFVAVRRQSLNAVLSAVKGQKIKGVRTIIEETR